MRGGGENTSISPADGNTWPTLGSCMRDLVVKNDMLGIYITYAMTRLVSFACVKFARTAHRARVDLCAVTA